jgi:hypothetical protein
VELVGPIFSKPTNRKEIQMNQITLDTVRQMMKRELGADSFIAGMVQSVTADPNIPTACINAKGELKYSPAFVSEHVKTEQDLFCLVFHEILHPAFGHFIHGRDEVSNMGTSLGVWRRGIKVRVLSCRNK